MQKIENALKTCENRTVETDWEWTLQPRFILGLSKQLLNVQQFNLEMEFPAMLVTSARGRPINGLTLT
jgi:hypothetical protein